MVIVACVEGRKTFDCSLSNFRSDGSTNDIDAWSSIMARPNTVSRDEGWEILTGHVRLKFGLRPVWKTVSFRLTKAVPLFPFCEFCRAELSLSRSWALGLDRLRLDGVDCYPLSVFFGPPSARGGLHPRTA